MTPTLVMRGELGSGMPSRAQYYRRQADIWRLSLLCDDDDVPGLRISKRWN